MLVPHAQLLLHLNDVALEVTNNCCTLHSLQPLTYLPDVPPQLRIPGVRFQALPRCVHCFSRSLKLGFRLGISLQSRPDLFRSWCGITIPTVRMMAAVNAASTPSTLMSHGGFTLGCLPTAVTTSCRSWGSVTRRLRSTGGPAGALSRRFLAKSPRSSTSADTMLWSKMGRKESWGCTVTFRTSFRSRCLVRM